MAGGALESRAEPTGGYLKEHTAEPGLRAAFLHTTMEQRTGQQSVSCPHGHTYTGCAGRDGRDAVYHWHLWHGLLCGQQAAAGVGHPCCHRCRTQGSTTASVGTSFEIADSGLGCGI